MRCESTRSDCATSKKKFFSCPPSSHDILTSACPRDHVLWYPRQSSVLWQTPRGTVVDSHSPLYGYPLLPSLPSLRALTTVRVPAVSSIVGKKRKNERKISKKNIKDVRHVVQHGRRLHAFVDIYCGPLHTIETVLHFIHVFLLYNGFHKLKWMNKGVRPPPYLTSISLAVSFSLRYFKNNSFLNQKMRWDTWWSFQCRYYVNCTHARCKRRAFVTDGVWSADAWRRGRETAASKKKFNY